MVNGEFDTSDDDQRDCEWKKVKKVEAFIRIGPVGSTSLGSGSQAMIDQV